jgi:predicted DNA-binding antitoxin AbrB/MazE fold protein
MVIRARFEKGVFKPLQEVAVEEGTEVDVYIRNSRKNGRKNHPLLTQLEAFGLWKNRTDFKDGLDYVNRSRRYRKK